MRIYLDTSAIVAGAKRRNEPEHEHARKIIESSPRKNEIVTSSLSLTELIVAYAKHTRAPPDHLSKLLDILIHGYGLEIYDHNDFLDSTKIVAFDRRELARKLDIPSADIHHVAAAHFLDAAILVSVDRKHLLKEEARKEFESYVTILSPTEAFKQAQL